jgi:hypothetical protein
MATVQDLLDSITADQATVTADQAKLTLDQSLQGTDDTAFLAGLAAAGITAFSVLSKDNQSVATYLIVPGATPPYTVTTTPIASSITIPTPPAPAGGG